jgi:hypothetical protein
MERALDSCPVLSPLVLRTALPPALATTPLRDEWRPPGTCACFPVRAGLSSYLAAAGPCVVLALLDSGTMEDIGAAGLHLTCRALSAGSFHVVPVVRAGIHSLSAVVGHIVVSASLSGPPHASGAGTGEVVAPPPPIPAGAVAAAAAAGLSFFAPLLDPEHSLAATAAPAAAQATATSTLGEVVLGAAAAAAAAATAAAGAPPPAPPDADAAVALTDDVAAWAASARTMRLLIERLVLARDGDNAIGRRWHLDIAFPSTAAAGRGQALFVRVTTPPRSAAAAGSSARRQAAAAAVAPAAVVQVARQVETPVSFDDAGIDAWATGSVTVTVSYEDVG